MSHWLVVNTFDLQSRGREFNPIQRRKLEWVLTKKLDFIFKKEMKIAKWGTPKKYF